MASASANQQVTMARTTGHDMAARELRGPLLIDSFHAANLACTQREFIIISHGLLHARLCQVCKVASKYTYFSGLDTTFYF